SGAKLSAASSAAALVVSLYRPHQTKLSTRQNTFYGIFITKSRKHPFLSLFIPSPTNKSDQNHSKPTAHISKPHHKPLFRLTKTESKQETEQNRQRQHLKINPANIC
ncbi:MAG TPA: hypothetical protein VG519_00595, partial [Pseudochrobactrum sp.]|nr:hypothetical protein [Pseudochrobactrum sp.]